jgi:ParB family chromosome partitioning protein
MEVPVNAVAPNPKQPRTRFDDETIATLAASIREVGILQPLVVRRAGDGRYELIAGERPPPAAKAAGLASVPIVLRDSEDADLLREALIENIHREDLNPIEQAEAFKRSSGSSGSSRRSLPIGSVCRGHTSRIRSGSSRFLWTFSSSSPTRRSPPVTRARCSRWATRRR